MVEAEALHRLKVWVYKNYMHTMVIARHYKDDDYLRIIRENGNDVNQAINFLSRLLQVGSCSTDRET